MGVWPNIARGEGTSRPRPGARHLLVGAGSRCGAETRRSMDAQTAGPERGMLKRLRGTARYFDRKVGLSRIGLVLSLTIIMVAAVVLYHLLRDIDPDALIDALEATDWRTLIFAGLFVAAGYLTLTFYDLFALRTIGRSEVPYRVAALGGLHQLRGGAQCRRQRLLRRRGALSHLFQLGAERHRSHQDLFCRRADVLARQCHGARARHTASAAGGAGDRSNAAVVQPRARAGDPGACSAPMSHGSGSSRA